MFSKPRASLRPLGYLLGLAWLWPSSVLAAANAGLHSEESECTVAGLLEPSLETPLTNDTGEVVARLTGTPVAAQLVRLPVIPSTFATIVTHPAGDVGFRVQAKASVRHLGLRATTRIDVVPNVLSIAAGASLDAVATSGPTIYVEKSLSVDFRQTLVTVARCAQLGLSGTTAKRTPLPSAAQAYRLDADTLKVFWEPTAHQDHSTTLRRNPEAKGLLVFGTLTKPGWLHILYEDEVGLSGWVTPDSLTALKAGELEDRAPRTLFRRAAPQMRVDESTRLVKAQAALTIHASTSQTGPTLGTIATGAEFYVLEVVAGWASVLPKELDIMPPANKSFWIRASDVAL